MSDVPSPAHAPAFEHVAFPIGLGFVAGFIDLFGFMAWYGLLAAHVTGNLIFLAAYTRRIRSRHAARRTATSSRWPFRPWFIGTISARQHPFLPVVVQTTLGACLIAGLVLPNQADDLHFRCSGDHCSRWAFNTMTGDPPTIRDPTVMTGNITHIVAGRCAGQWGLVRP